jgi:hypothetical protein
LSRQQHSTAYPLGPVAECSKLIEHLGLVALGIVSANAVFAAWNFLYYHLRPTPELPPWKDPQILNFGLLFLTAPCGMIVGFIAGLRGTSWWLVGVMLAASLPMLVVGLLAGASV